MEFPLALGHRGLVSGCVKIGRNSMSKVDGYFSGNTDLCALPTIKLYLCATFSTISRLISASDALGRQCVEYVRWVVQDVARRIAIYPCKISGAIIWVVRSSSPPEVRHFAGRDAAGGAPLGGRGRTSLHYPPPSPARPWHAGAAKLPHLGLDPRAAKPAGARDSGDGD
jgi:hypothetical protein